MSIDGHIAEVDIESESGLVYWVCLITETCDCPNATYQDGACKHQCLVEMAFGQRRVPDLDEETDVEISLLPLAYFLVLLVAAIRVSEKNYLISSLRLRNNSTSWELEHVHVVAEP